MSFLRQLLDRLKSVTELEEGEDRDVIKNTVDMITFLGKIEWYTKFNKELYVALDKELREDIEKMGIFKIKTETVESMYEFEVNRLKRDINTAREKVEELKGNTYNLVYSYELKGNTKNINNMIIYVI